MAFRENLKSLLNFKGIKVADLAEKTEISKRTIDQYLATSAKIPSAENAVKIAKALKTTVEFLVTGQDAKISNKTTEELQILFQYSHTIHALNKIPPQSQEVIKAMIQNLSNSMEIEKSICEQQMKKNGKALNVAEK